MAVKAPKKLIEVALPLDAINKAAAREKSIRHGHPSTLHLWWARRPLAAARAVLFAQLVNDPGGERGWGKYKGQTKEDAERERQRLFALIEKLVQWENTNNEEVLAEARAEIWKSWRETCEMNKGKPGFDPDKLPPFHDPFAGGGSIPLEAQRLGLEAHASDLNPVAVLINKAMIEIPPKFAGRPPVGPRIEGEKQTKAKATEDWSGARALAEDVRRYGAWMREEAFKRIGHLYPKVKITAEMAEGRDDLRPYVGKELTVIAWLWARTVASPNPAFGRVHVPLVSSFWLGKKKGKEAWVEPVVNGASYQFRIRTGEPANPSILENGTKSGRGSNFQCILSGAAIVPNYIKEESKAGRMKTRLMAVVAEGDRGRVYLDPTLAMERLAEEAQPSWVPEQELPKNPRWFSPPDYGMPRYADLFTKRQLVALNTLCDLVGEARAKAIEDAKQAGWQDDAKALAEGGTGATAYGDAIAVYLAFALSRSADRGSSICSWDSSPKMEALRNTFGRQAIPMVWDFAEGNLFSESSGNWINNIEWVGKAVTYLSGKTGSVAIQKNATALLSSESLLISTDPPYYDNIGYADLSDFFYVWLRRVLARPMPDIFATLLVPKAEELIATPYRHGGNDAAEEFFLKGMTEVMANMAQASHGAFPVTIYYAFRQSETKGAGTASTGWETFLGAVLKAGFSITGTWPMRTELGNRMVSSGTNALASSIVLVCRKREADTPQISRRQFLRELNEELPVALEIMIGGKEGVSPIAPVDLAQAAIGPGTAIFSKYSAVLEADGSPMTVRNALIHINKAIDDYFTGTEGEMDADTRFCVDWFQQYGFKSGPFGEADVLSRAKGTSVEGVAKSGVLASGGGKVHLLPVSEYAADWDPEADERTPVWEACHQLCRALQDSESAAGALLARMPARQEPIRQLAYRLYTVCERKGWAQEARFYNELITSWHGIVEESHRAGHRGEQMPLKL